MKKEEKNCSGKKLVKIESFDQANGIKSLSPIKKLTHLYQPRLMFNQGDQMWQNFIIWGTFFRFGKKIEVYFLFGKILGDSWQLFYAMGLFLNL